MDYGKLLSRSFEITRKYRALWLFGILLALFGGSGGGGNFGNLGNFGGGNGSGGTGGAGGFPQLSAQLQQIIAILILAVVCFVLIWIVLSIILRFVSRGALIGLVQELEVNAATPTVRRGFSIGGGRFWQLLGIALTINLPLFIVSLLLILVAALPALAAIIPMINAGRSANEIGGMLVGSILGSVLLLCCVGILLWGVALILRPFYEFFVRECVIQKRGVFDSIREGYRIVRANLGNVAVLYILIIGIGIGYAILMFVIGLVLVGIALAAGVAVGFAVAATAGSTSQAIVPGIIAGVIVGIPLLLIVLFISGLYQTFESTMWTEGYLAIIALKTPGVAS
jgi:hypothetical protein